MLALRFYLILIWYYLIHARIYQESSEGNDNPDLKESIFREVTSPILATAKRHEGYQTLWQICYDISDTVLLRNLMVKSHDHIPNLSWINIFLVPSIFSTLDQKIVMEHGSYVEPYVAA